MSCVQVHHKGNDYYVCPYIDGNKTRLFVVDKDIFDKYIYRKINLDVKYYLHNGNIVHSNLHEIDKAKRHYYLEDYVASKIETIDEYNTVHNISGLPQDMRMENIQWVNQPISNEFKKISKKKQAPPGMTTDDLPKGITYNSKTGKFIIKVVHNGKKFRVDSTTKDNISIAVKFELAKWHLKYISEENEHIKEYKDILKNYSDHQIKLMIDFNRIITKSKIRNYEKSLVDIPIQTIVEVNFNKFTRLEKEYIDTYIHNFVYSDDDGKWKMVRSSEQEKGKLYYIPFRGAVINSSRGIQFKIQNHPRLNDGKWVGPSAKKKPTDEKYLEMMNIFKEIGDLSDDKYEEIMRKVRKQQM